MDSQKALVVLNHQTISDYKAAHGNNELRIFNSKDSQGVLRVFFTCGSTTGAISSRLELPIAPGTPVQVITVQGERGPLDILCRQGGLEPMQVL